MRESEPRWRPMSAPRQDAGAAIERLIAIMAALRDPVRGCPWDKEQSFDTIAPYTIEEAYEVADAIARRDWPALEDELGDLLFQVVYYAQMGAEDGRFDFVAIATAIADKMVRRHPHVFGDASFADAEAQTANWEEIKRAERAAAGEADRSALAGISRGLPEWQRAVKLQSRAARTGFDWPGPEPVIAKLHEEIEEVRAEFARGAVDDNRERLQDDDPQITIGAAGKPIAVERAIPIIGICMRRPFGGLAAAKRKVSDDEGEIWVLKLLIEPDTRRRSAIRTVPGRQDHSRRDQRAAACPGWDDSHAWDIGIEHEQADIRVGIPIRLTVGDRPRAAHQTQYEHHRKDRCNHNFLHVLLLFIANLE